MKQITLQGHAHRRERVYSKWVQIVEFYEKNGAKETVDKFKISRSHLYYIIRQMNSKVI